MGCAIWLPFEKFTRADLSKIALECNYLFKTQQRDAVKSSYEPLRSP